MSEGKGGMSPLKIVLLVIAVSVLFTLVTVGIVNLLLNQKRSPTPETMLGTGPTYSLDAFNVNLADQDSRRFLKATVTLELSESGVAKELQKREAQIRDIIIGLFREKKAAELKDGNQAIIELKSQMVKHLNAILTSGEISAVYFTEFIVQ